MSLFQYAFDFYCACAKHSNIDYVKVDFGLNKLKSIRVADSFKEVPKSLNIRRAFLKLVKYIVF